jgi:CubicO group peptidase (beta-lactamase class C family)
MASRIDLLVERLENLAREHHVPGMGLAVVTPDGVFTRGIGVTDLETGSAVSPETIFEIGSITKTFTAMLVARLAAEEKIDFDDPVREHVPYFHLR